jgi:uncharacterized membrane protein
MTVIEPEVVTPEPAPKKKKTVWIIVGIIAVVLVCCCIVAIVVGYQAYQTNVWGLFQ